MTSANYFGTLSSMENICAFKIQSTWRSHKIRTFKKNVPIEENIGIKVFYTSLSYNIKWTTDSERVKHIFNALKAEYKAIDILYDKEEWTEIKKLDSPLPGVVINGLFVGSYQQVQDLQDIGQLEAIINRDYLRKCLNCNCSRTDLLASKCAYCWKDYLFFSKEEKKKAITQMDTLDRM